MFTQASTAPRETIEGRHHIWHSKPGLTPTEDLITVHCTIPPGGSHLFHIHPNKEEVIYVIEGEAEQWIEEDKQTLGPGDSAYIPKNAVHATFNHGDKDLKFIAIVSPCTADGPVIESVEHLEPWKSIVAKMESCAAVGV